MIRRIRKAGSQVGSMLGGDSILQPRAQDRQDLSARGQVENLLRKDRLSEYWRKSVPELERLFLDAARDWASASGVRFREMARVYKQYKNKCLPRRAAIRFVLQGRPIKPARQLSKEACLFMYLEELEQHLLWLTEMPAKQLSVSERKQARLIEKCEQLIELLEQMIK